MNDKQTTFLEKIKDLPVEDLLRYRTTAKNLIRSIDVIGVMCIITMLFFPEVIFVISFSVLTFFLARISTNIGYSLLEINGLLQKRATGR